MQVSTKLRIPSEITSERVHAGRFIEQHLLTYVDEGGVMRKYEAAQRVGGQNAVTIIATWDIDGVPHLVLVKQFRPPIGCLSLELPAGLIDGAETPGTTARRELEEETGCVGHVTYESALVCSSPGLTGEKTALVCLTVDSQGERRLEDGEHIDVIFMPIKGLCGRLEEEAAGGVAVGAKLWSYAIGLEASAQLNPA